jgi:hypothetical protein
MEQFRRVAHCPHCGNESTHRLIHKQLYLEKTFSAKDGSERRPAPWSTFVVICETCQQVLLYDNPGNHLGEKDFHLCSLIYPKSGLLHHSVPERIRKIYTEASSIKQRSPNGYAVLIRRAVEAMCDDRNAKKSNNLKVRLDDLRDKEKIPPDLAEDTHILRILGAIGAHEKEVLIHPTQVHLIDGFFKALIEYLYVAPSKIREFKDRLEKSIKKTTS